MEIIKEADFRKEIKSAPRTGYLFFGDEDYLKAFAKRQAKEQVCSDPTIACFNDLHLDAVDFTPNALLDALTPLPMMADRKLVTVGGLNFNTMRQSEVDALCEVLARLEEFDYNVLIITVAADCFDPGYLPKRPSETLKKLGEFLTPVHFERTTDAKLIAWIGKHFAHNGVSASPALCAKLLDYCGHSMFILAGEIDKLSYYTLAHGETEATEETMQLVCTAATEYDAFAFTNAVMDSRPEIALGILADYRLRRLDPILILSDVIRVICEMIAVHTMTESGIPAAQIGQAVGKLHEYKVGLYQKSLRNTSRRRLHRALEACESADKAIKSSADGYAALERLICTL